MLCYITILCSKPSQCFDTSSPHLTTVIGTGISIPMQSVLWLHWQLPSSKDCRLLSEDLLMTSCLPPKSTINRTKKQGIARPGWLASRPWAGKWLQWCSVSMARWRATDAGCGRLCQWLPWHSRSMNGKGGYYVGVPMVAAAPHKCCWKLRGGCW